MDGGQGEGALGSRAGDEDSALKGISFAAMSAPGPSCARYEHLRSFLRIKRKCVVDRLLRVLETFLGRALGGDLRCRAHWVLHSQLTFLCKPGSDTPRPIRAGDHLRRLVGKHLLVKFGARIRKVVLGFLQFGVAVLGGGGGGGGGVKLSSMRGALWRRWRCVVAWERWLWWTSTSSISSGFSSGLRHWTLWWNTCLFWSHG